VQGEAGRWDRSVGDRVACRGSGGGKDGGGKYKGRVKGRRECMWGIGWRWGRGGVW
jgi:hypothetical protein